MTKKQSLGEKVKALTTKVNELVLTNNNLEIRLTAAFKKIKDDRDKDRRRLDHLENTLLIGDFKTKIAGKTNLKL